MFLILMCVFKFVSLFDDPERELDLLPGATVVTLKTALKSMLGPRRAAGAHRGPSTPGCPFPAVSFCLYA